MKAYVLDTDTLIYFLNGRESVIRRFAALPPQALHTTIINHAELFHGAYHSDRKIQNLAKVEAFLARLPILPFCEHASRLFAEHKARLRRKGTPLADLDLMIAGIALHHGMALVTNNLRHMGRIPGLATENWVTNT